MTVNQLVKDALDKLLTVQEIVAEPAYRVGIVDVLIIREKTDKAVRSLLAADVILSEQKQ